MGRLAKALALNLDVFRLFEVLAGPAVLIVLDDEKYLLSVTFGA